MPSPENSEIVGICVLCEEPVLAADRQDPHQNCTHAECMFRAIVGGVEHLQRKCSCYGGKGGHPAQGTTPRKAARAAWDLFQKLEALGVDVFAERVRR